MLEGPGGFFSLTLSMKMKVLMLSTWPSPDMVFEGQLGVHMESKMLAKFLEKVRPKIVSKFGSIFACRLESNFGCFFGSAWPPLGCNFGSIFHFSATFSFMLFLKMCSPLG